MDLKTFNSSQRPSPQYSGPFDLNCFAAREQRRTERLVLAAYAVGHTHEWFVKLSKGKREAKVREWVDDALKARAVRLGNETYEWALPDGFLET